MTAQVPWYGVHGLRLNYSDAELRSMFASYQGSDPVKETYGGELLGVYKIFESFNALDR